MRQYLYAAAIVLLTATGAWANPCNGTNVNNCQNGNGNSLNSPSQSQSNNNAFTPTNTFNPTATNQQQQTFSPTNTNNATGGNGYGGQGYGGAGGQGGQGGAGGNATSSANATANSNSTSSANNGGQSNAQYTTTNYPKQAPAIAVNAAALSGLPSSECVLAFSQSVGFGGSFVGTGVLASEGTGESKPDHECNERMALPYVAAVKGQIQGHDSMEVYATMLADLTGVQDAIDKLNGKTQTVKQNAQITQNTQVSDTVNNHKCAGMNTATAWYKANCP